MREENNNALFHLNTNISKDDAKDGISERVTQLRAVINYILADAISGEPSVNNEDLFGAVWTLEKITHEIEILQSHI